jgi:hypothetical protein
VKERWLLLDGNRLHITLPFEGIRFSLIHFIVSRFEDALADVRGALCESGFDFEWGEHRARSLTDPLKLPLGIPDRPDQVHAWAQETALHAFVPETHEAYNELVFTEERLRELRDCLALIATDREFALAVGACSPEKLSRWGPRARSAFLCAERKAFISSDFYRRQSERLLSYSVLLSAMPSSRQIGGRPSS